MTPWKDRIKAAHTAPMTSEDRLRDLANNARLQAAAVLTADLREVLSTLDALRKSYQERGEAIERLLKDRDAGGAL